jgi:hypothetical protein
MTIVKKPDRLACVRRIFHSPQNQAAYRRISTTYIYETNLIMALVSIQGPHTITLTSQLKTTASRFYKQKERINVYTLVRISLRNYKLVTCNSFLHKALLQLLA